MTFKSSYAKEAPGIPSKQVIDHFKRKYDYDVDDYYGYMFNIPNSKLHYEIGYARNLGFELYLDPDNADWYYLMKVDSK